MLTVLRKMVSGITAAVLLSAFILCPFSTSAEEQTEVCTEISDAAGFLNIANAPDGHYKLTSDIDLGGSDWTPVPFCGKLDGAGHTLYNLRITGVGDDKRQTKDGNLKDYDTAFAGLFSVLENAEVTNLSVKGAYVNITERSHCFAAILAGYSDNSTVNNCAFEGRVRLVNRGINAGVAGMIGYGTRITVKGCSADVELVFEDQYTEGKCEQFLGGVFSCGIGNITDCNIHINAYDSCHGYVHNGGMVGMFYHCGSDYSKRTVQGNHVAGQITFFEDNRDRRAYCKPFAGEMLTPAENIRDNTHTFKSNETKDFTKVLSPESCEQPDYEEIHTPPDCRDWGYTTHTCRHCGYSWIDTYLPPQHEPGEWITVSDSDSVHEGLQKQYCAKCGEPIGERTIPVKPDESTFNSTPLFSPAAMAICVLIPVGLALITILLIKKRNH